MDDGASWIPGSADKRPPGCENVRGGAFFLQATRGHGVRAAEAGNRRSRGDANGASPTESLNELARYSAPGELRRSERNVLKKAVGAVDDASRLRVATIFLNAAAEIRKEGNLSVAPDVAFATTVAFGRRASLLRFLLPGLWMSAGLWLADTPGIAAFW